MAGETRQLDISDIITDKALQPSGGAYPDERTGTILDDFVQALAEGTVVVDGEVTDHDAALADLRKRGSGELGGLDVQDRDQQTVRQMQRYHNLKQIARHPVVPGALFGSEAELEFIEATSASDSDKRLPVDGLVDDFDIPMAPLGQAEAQVLGWQDRPERKAQVLARIQLAHQATRSQLASESQPDDSALSLPIAPPPPSVEPCTSRSFFEQLTRLGVPRQAASLASMMVATVLPSEFLYRRQLADARLERAREAEIEKGIGELTLRAHQGQVDLDPKLLDPIWSVIKAGKAGVRFPDIFNPHKATILEEITPLPKI